MPELEPAGHIAEADEIARDQLVQGGKRLRLRQLRHRHREVELERIARHRGGLDEPPHGGLETVDLPRDRRADRGGYGAVGARTDTTPGELQQGEGGAT